MNFNQRYRLKEKRADSRGRNCKIYIDKNQRSNEPGDFFFTWKIKVFGRGPMGKKHAFTICSPEKKEYDSIVSCRKIALNFIEEFNFQILEHKGGDQ